MAKKPIVPIPPSPIEYENTGKVTTTLNRTYHVIGFDFTVKPPQAVVKNPEGDTKYMTNNQVDQLAKQ